MDIQPRHVICILGQWKDFSNVEEIVQKCSGNFTLDREYSQVAADDRMMTAFEASASRFEPSMTDEDWDHVQSHTAVAYVLSPPMTAETAEHLSAAALILTATLLNQGGVAAKSESAGLAHGRQHWIELARQYRTALAANDHHQAAALLYWTWVYRPIHDDENGVYYSLGMHLLGHRDVEIADSVDVTDSIEWIDLLGLYLVADKPDRKVGDGDGFRLRDEGPRRIIQHSPCTRYDEDEFFFNPYGYIRLMQSES